MTRFLHISVVWGVNAKTTDQLKSILDIAPDWLTYGNSNWILYTTEDLVTWQGRFLAIIDTGNDLCFICEIPDIHTTGGWLPKWIWDWMRQPRDNAPLYSLSPPSSPFRA